MFKKNWFKVALVLTILAFAIVIAMETTDTMALFSDSGSSTENVFTAGTVDMKLNGADNVTATWVSPDGWIPSYPNPDDMVDGSAVEPWEATDFSAELNFTNVGTADINEMSIGFDIVSRTDPGSDGSQLDKVILVTEWEECFNGVCESFLTEITSWCDSGLSGGLYLYELDACNDFLDSGAPGPVTQDSVAGTDGILLAAGDQQDYSLTLGFHFDGDAGNEFQGDSIELNVNFEATPEKIYYP